MKKKWLILLLIILCVGCSQQIKYTQPSGSTSDMSGYNGLVTEQFVNISAADVCALFDSNVTTIVYIGYDTCPWCNCLVPVLDEVSKVNDMKIYYMNFHANINFDDKDSIDTIVDYCDKAGLLEKDEEDQPIFYFPTVLYIRDGLPIQLHIGTVSGHDASNETMTEKQTARLKYQLQKEFNVLVGIE